MQEFTHLIKLMVIKESILCTTISPLGVDGKGIRLTYTFSALALVGVVTSVCAIYVYMREAGILYLLTVDTNGMDEVLWHTRCDTPYIFYPASKVHLLL